jgi:hypothetical protein
MNTRPATRAEEEEIDKRTSSRRKRDDVHSLVEELV